MIRLCKHNQENVLDKVRNGQLDAIALSSTNLIDDIILHMNSHKIFDCLKDNIPDKRAQNNTIPYELIWACSIAAKMKVQTSLTDIPFAINDHKTLAELGYTLIDDNSNLKAGLMQESSLRFLLNKYDSSLFVDGYNNTVQNGILPLLDIVPDIHILDCTDLEVNYFNEHYEESGIAKSKRDNMNSRGYKLATLRGIVEDTGIIEDIRFGSLNTHDLKLSEEMLKTSPMLKENDILINDRGFLSRELINYLKTERKVDTYIPLRRNMESYKMAVLDAKYKNDWHEHPTNRRTSQVITLVDDLGENWRGSNPKEDVPINGCVVWDEETDEYFVFVTTDITKSAKDILNIYELRPEIEEDYRQLKDFWKIEDFKSTKINVILFHIVCVLFGYLFFQLYTLFPEGAEFIGKSLPVILKKYLPKVQPYVVLYTGYEFGVLKLIDLMELYAHCDETVQSKFKTILTD
ncbi:transposase [Emergencia sp.]|uniref:transposase n=1 Tax=Emergencia sp. TaxID=1926557 RepID=UPI003AF14F80